MNWWLRGIEECFKTDLATLLGNQKSRRAQKHSNTQKSNCKASNNLLEKVLQTAYRG